MYDIVQIDDDDLLYRRVPPHHFRRDGRISPGTYARTESQGPGQPRIVKPDTEISVDLARFITPEETVAAGHSPEAKYGLGVLKVGDVRKLGFTVRHQPTKNNYAHCVIEGVESEIDRTKLRDITRIIIRP